MVSKGKLSSAILSRRDLSQIPAIDVVNTSVETLHLVDQNREVQHMSTGNPSESTPNPFIGNLRGNNMGPRIFLETG